MKDLRRQREISLFIDFLTLKPSPVFLYSHQIKIKFLSNHFLS